MIIVFEGGDQAGKKTQSSLLTKKLKSLKIKTELFSFPDYTTPIGKEINKYLHGKRSFSPQTIHCLLAANRWEKVEKIKKIIDDNSLLIESYKLKMVHDDIIKQIIEIDQAIKLEWLNSFDFNNELVNENLGTYLSKAKTKEEILLAYSLNGVTNGNKLFSLIEKKLNLFKSFINKYDSLQLLSSNDVNFIIKYAFIYNLKNIIS